MGKDNDTVEEAFDVTEFAKRHLRVSSWANERSQVYSSKELHELVKCVIPLFQKEQSLATMSPPCTIVGDIHGQYRDLIRILNCRHANDVRTADKNDKKYGFASTRFMFLGDFVDRGSHSVECICLVFALKVLFPTQYVLLRGNHETKAINFAYGFREELVNKLGPKEGIEVWEHFNEAFSWMPLAGLVGGKILCMHGGISPLLTNLSEINKIPRPLPDVNENKLAQDLLWSDPLDHANINAISEQPQYLKNVLRGLSCVFNEAAVKDCANRLNVQLFVRAHQMMDNGFRFFADRKLVTIFSAPRYMNETENKGAVLKVAANGGVSIVTLKARKNERHYGQEECTRGDLEMPKQGSIMKNPQGSSNKKSPK